jgi:hypothetical protein
VKLMSPDPRRHFWRPSDPTGKTDSQSVRQHGRYIMGGAGLKSTKSGVTRA